MKSVVFLAAVALLSSGCGSNRLGKAEELLNHKAYAEASKLIEEEILDNPGNGRAFFLKAKVAYHKDDSAAFGESLDQALSASPNLKDEMARWLFEIGQPALPDEKKSSADGEEGELETAIPDMALVKAYELKPDLFDETTCYRWWVLGQGTEQKFIDKFPSSPRLPSIMLKAAEKAIEYDRPAAKEWFTKLVKQYPKSEEGKTAKTRLADWWERTSTSLPLDSQWHRIIEVKKGTQFRLRITGNARISMGALGYSDITPDWVIAYTGNNPRTQVRGLSWGTIDRDVIRASGRFSDEMFANWHNYIVGGEASDWRDVRDNYFIPGSSSSRKAPQSGSLYLRVDSNAYETFFSVEVEWKEP
ncbi:MAG: hypothetical protein M5U21_06250 [Fimbriimonadaceae bacterium]|nr:hypothetical protein [Fimbriimonadaceae bacterium]